LQDWAEEKVERKLALLSLVSRVRRAALCETWRTRKL
jgi:hypothetical protein